jgi:inner membrane protein
MDPVTHTAIGFTIGQAGAKRLTKNWAWVMLLASGAPDVDVLFFLPTNVNGLDWHRHFTHAPLFAPLLAAAVVLAVKYVLRREIAVRGAFLLALMGILAHHLVDLLTYRGTRLLLPFSDEQFGLKIESFFDPVLYVILGLGFAIPFLSNLVSGEIGAKRGSGALAAWMMLFVASGWVWARYSFKEQALAELSSRIYEGAAPRRVDVMPTYHPFRFLGMVEGEEFQKVLDLELLDYFDPEGGQTFFKQVPGVEAGKALRLATASKSAQVFLAWARWPRPVVTRLDGETRWVVVIEELVVEQYKSRPRLIIRMDENYAIQSEVYERAKSTTGF